MYKELKAEAGRLRAAADLADARAEQEHMKAAKKGGIEAWLGYEFESSSSLTPEFASFAKQYKAALKKKLAGFELLGDTRGHFFLSFFFRNKESGKIVYISCDDVRFSPDGWYNNLLIRIADHAKDYTGGSNYFVDWNDLQKAAMGLTK